MKLRFCVICGTNKNIEHHHVTPVCKGGTDHQHNFISLCVEHHAMIHSVRPGSWAHRKELQKIGIEKAKKERKRVVRSVKYLSIFSPICILLFSESY